MSKIKIDNVRLSFPSLYQKAVFNGEATKYTATFLFEKESATHKKVKKALADFIAEKFADKPPKGIKHTFLVDGDEKEYEGYENKMALKASSAKRVLTIDTDKTVLTEEDGKLYAGCYVNAIVELWYSDHALGGKQILATLQGVQFAKHGEAFSSGGSSIDDFDDISDDDEF